MITPLDKAENMITRDDVPHRFPFIVPRLARKMVIFDMHRKIWGDCSL